MPLYIKKYKNNNDQSEAYLKTYGRVMYLGTADIDEISEKIQEKCTVHKADVVAVLSALSGVVRDELQSSKRVYLPDLGTFKLGVRTKGEEKPEDFNMRDNILSTHVIFQPVTTVENGHRVKALVKGVRHAEAPKYEGLEPSTGGGSSGGSNSGSNSGNSGNSGDDPIETQP